MNRADLLHITRGPVWLLGTTDEERALLDPLPAGVEIVVDRDVLLDEDDDVSHVGSEPMAAAVIVVDAMSATPELLDDTLPRVGSVPLVWIVLPAEITSADADQIEQLAREYGWSAAERVDLGDAWSAVRLKQD
ncbi:MAG: hypothetical protein WB508_05480 [Aeromicrobium sp.]|uniref:hypothetical protein n=1 Tax=Aeromicrobium sp. TaxID=1871063 RepID=UPI003C675451